MIRSILFLLAWLGAALPAYAQATEDGGRATLELLQPSTVIKQADLDFGTIVASGAGTVTVNPSNNAVSTTGALTLLGNDATRAVFLGERRGISFAYVEIDNQVTLVETSGTGGAPMTASLTLSVTNVIWGFRRGPGFVLLVVGPSQNYYVGGTLTVPDGQLSGIYEGTFDITVDNP